MQPCMAEDAAVTGSDDESLGIHSLVFLQKENSQRESEGARQEMSLVTDSKEQPLEHELLGHSDPGQQGAGCGGHVKVETAGTRDVVVTGGSAVSVLVRVSRAAPGSSPAVITQGLHCCAQHRPRVRAGGELRSREG